MKTMAEVLNEHALHLITPVRLDDMNGPWEVECNCTAEPIQGPSYLGAEQAFAAHQAAALSAAGFGPVQEAAAAGVRSVVDIWAGGGGRRTVRITELDDAARTILAAEWDDHIKWNMGDIRREQERRACAAAKQAAS